MPQNERSGHACHAMLEPMPDADRHQSTWWQSGPSFVLTRIVARVSEARGASGRHKSNSGVVSVPRHGRLVPPDAGAQPIWYLERAIAQHERFGENRVGPVLPRPGEVRSTRLMSACQYRRVS